VYFCCRVDRARKGRRTALLLVVKHLGEALRQIREAGVTILLADQNVKFCRRIANRGYILEKGLIQFEGTMAAIWENEAILSKYLAV
jgi:branched-chain amino acid transport system ATP-binding protein